MLRLPSGTRLRAIASSTLGVALVAIVLSGCSRGSSESSTPEAVANSLLEGSADTPSLPRGSVASVRSAAVPSLIACLDDRRPEVRVRAARVLARIVDPRVPLALRADLKDPECGVRAAAASALGSLKDASSVRALVACLNEAAANRKKAEGAIIPDSDPLIEGLRRKLAAEPHLSLCSNIVEALANIGDAPAIGVLVESLKNPSPELRRFAAHSLLRAGYTTTNDGERICLLIASEDWRGLLAMGKRSVAPLFSFYTQEHDYMALQTLAKFGPRSMRSSRASPMLTVRCALTPSRSCRT